MVCVTVRGGRRGTEGRERTTHNIHPPSSRRYERRTDGARQSEWSGLNDRCGGTEKSKTEAKVGVSCVCVSVNAVGRSPILQ